MSKTFTDEQLEKIQKVLARIKFLLGLSEEDPGEIDYTDEI
jgi:hypothetical protein